MEKNEKNPPYIKAILIGETGVGKTNLINVSVGLNFIENRDATFSNSFVEKSFQISDKKYNMQIWDTIGQEKFKHLTKLFFKNSKIVILVYDKSVKATFTKLDFWMNELKEVLGNDDIILAIVGNKEDLDEGDDDVDEDEAREYAQKYNAKFRMASAKMNSKGFISFLRELLIDYIRKTGGVVEEDNDRIVLEKEKEKTETKKKSFFKC
jgi:small GTP-binding protein